MVAVKINIDSRLIILDDIVNQIEEKVRKCEVISLKRAKYMMKPDLLSNAEAFGGNIVGLYTSNMTDAQRKRLDKILEKYNNLKAEFYKNCDCKKVEKEKKLI